MRVPGGGEAAMSISLHAGHDPFGTGGQRARSIRLFVKDLKDDGSGWVVGAYAYGDVNDANDAQLAMDSPLARSLEAFVRTFQLSARSASER